LVTIRQWQSDLLDKAQQEPRSFEEVRQKLATLRGEQSAYHRSVRFKEEVDEVLEALYEGDEEHAIAELGDVMFAAQMMFGKNINWGASLQATIQKIGNRAEMIEQLAADHGWSPSVGPMSLEKFKEYAAEAKKKFP
jgi:uncharacterized protein YabN with tetrapyrrole methylase and pyrophosphatase domain